MIVSVVYLDSMKNTINVLYGRIILLSLELAELNMEALKQILSFLVNIIFVISEM